MRHLDRDYDDSVHAQLRSSYERGLRDARRQRRSSPLLLWAAAGAVVVGGAMAAITLTGGTVLGGAAPETHGALRVSSEDSGDVVVGEGDWDLH